jgi:hypothetical protein
VRIENAFDEIAFSEIVIALGHPMLHGRIARVENKNKG